MASQQADRRPVADDFQDRDDPVVAQFGFRRKCSRVPGSRAPCQRVRSGRQPRAVRRTLTRSHAPVHLRARGTRAEHEARDANRTGTVPDGDHLHMGTHTERVDTHDAPKPRRAHRVLAVVGALHGSRDAESKSHGPRKAEVRPRAQPDEPRLTRESSVRRHQMETSLINELFTVSVDHPSACRLSHILLLPQRGRSYECAISRPSAGSHGAIAEHSHNPERRITRS